MNYLITGATGFIGRQLVNYLNTAANSVTIITRREKLGCIRTISPKEIEEYLSENNKVTIVNLATVYGRENHNLTELIECNVILSNTLLAAAVKFKVCRFVNIDSYYSKFPKIENLENYQVSKIQFRHWLKKASHEIPIVNLYLHHVYGENDNQQKLIPKVIEAIQTKEQICLTDCEQLRDFIYVSDVVRAIEYTSLMKLKDEFTEIEIATGKPMKLRSFLTKIYKTIANDNHIEEILKFGSLDRNIHEPIEIEYRFNLLSDYGFTINFSADSGIKKMLQNID